MSRVQVANSRRIEAEDIGTSPRYEFPDMQMIAITQQTEDKTFKHYSVLICSRNIEENNQIQASQILHWEVKVMNKIYTETKTLECHERDAR